MKFYLLIVSFFFLLLGCNKSIVKYDSLMGTYEYVYEYNTVDLNENHYIILKMNNNVIVGRYYGTSDDFDNAREGYLPGFYVAEMKDLSILNNNLSFSMSLNEDELFLKPINHNTLSANEVNTTHNPRWIKNYQPGLRLARNSVSFHGSITHSDISITTRHGNRMFKKVR